MDVFFEAMTLAQTGDILVIDNSGREDEGCIGDLTAVECRTFGISGIAIWGCHRDTRELIELDFPVFSYGSCPFGPTRETQGTRLAFADVHFGDFLIEAGDILFADDDGLIFTSGEDIEKLINIAFEIKEMERKQVETVQNGICLHEQFQFENYLDKHKHDPEYTFRMHLRQIGGAIEE